MLCRGRFCFLDLLFFKTFPSAARRFKEEVKRDREGQSNSNPSYRGTDKATQRSTTDHRGAAKVRKGGGWQGGDDCRRKGKYLKGSDDEIYGTASSGLEGFRMST